jgi:hypothetical protein
VESLFFDNNSPIYDIFIVDAGFLYAKIEWSRGVKMFCQNEAAPIS